MTAVPRVQGRLSAFHSTTRLCIVALQNAKAPVTTLPPELLSSIFEDAVSSAHDSLACTYAVPLVCGSYRSVTLERAALWSHLFVDTQLCT